MNTQIPRVAERIRRSEYTGENRCTPCTLLNVGIAAAITVAVGLVSVPAAFAAAAVSLAAIYFRGYLVPGTPTITARYLPERVLRWFDKGTDGDGVHDVDADGGVSETPEAPGDLLISADVVGDCEDEDDLCLDGAFERVWWRRIRQLQEGDRARNLLGSILEVDPDDLGFDDGEDRFDVTFQGDRIGGWASRAAFLADLAAEPTLAEWLPDWDGLDERSRTELLASMRAFLEECPACEAPLDTVEDVRKSCCSNDVVSVSVDCDDCGATVFSGSYR